MLYDVIIIGGSYAGQSAALQLARTRHSILVIDSGIRRNRFADSSHGFLTQDGTSPEMIAKIAKDQLLKYKTVEWINYAVKKAESINDYFKVITENGEEKTGKRIILATGIKDNLPEVKGINERWGKSVFHCPFCHGYELDQKPLGVLATSPASMHHALMLPDWGPTTFFLNDVFKPNDEEMLQLKKRNVTIENQKIECFEGENANVRLIDGRLIELSGMFVAPKLTMSNTLAEQLGCEFEEDIMGISIKTDAMKETTIKGVYACGDMARLAGSVTFAVSDGALAGVSAYRSLLLEKI